MNDDNPLQLLDEKIADLQKALAIEAGEAVKFQLKRQIEEAKAELERLENQGWTRPDSGPLPLDEIPPITPLPPHSRMPYLPNPLFVGRDKELKALAKMLHSAGQTMAISQAATTGLGGMGKSQLAVEFAHRYGHYFPGGVFWLAMGNPAGIANEVAACGGIEGLMLPGWQGAALDDQVALVKRAWQGVIARLLIFDNCEEVALLGQWRPTGGGCRVLVTSRRGEWPTTLGLQLLHLETLARPDSVALLSRFLERQLGPQEEGTLAKIAAEVGDLPLALHLVGSYLASYRAERFGQPGAVLARLQNPKLLDDKILTGYAAGHSPTAHDLHVGRTFALSLERLEEAQATDRLARQLLSRAACLAAGSPIPRTLLLAEGDEAAEPEMAADGLKRLVGVGLLEREAEGYTIHRLVAAHQWSDEPVERLPLFYGVLQ